MNISERPIWDEERGLMTVEEHRVCLLEYRTAQEEKEQEEIQALRQAGECFNYKDISVSLQTELRFQGVQGVHLWGRSRMTNSLYLALSDSWPAEWKKQAAASAWYAEYILPEGLRHGRSTSEVVSLLAFGALRLGGGKAAVTRFMKSPRRFLELEDRYRTRARLAQ